MAEAERWPIDFDAAKKGDRLSVGQLEPILGVPRFVRIGGFGVENAEYQKLLKDLQGKVKRELRDRGIPMTVACDHGELIFLADEEASPYNVNLFRSGERRMRTALRQMMECDRDAMKPETRTKHDRSLVVMGAKVAGMRRLYRPIEPMPHQRNTPGLPGPAPAPSL